MDEQMDAMGNSSGGGGGGGGEGEGGGTNKYSTRQHTVSACWLGGINGDVHVWSWDRSSSEIHIAK